VPGAPHRSRAAVSFFVANYVGHHDPDEVVDSFFLGRRLKAVFHEPLISPKFTSIKFSKPPNGLNCHFAVAMWYTQGDVTYVF
jgi:hypothetical protein